MLASVCGIDQPSAASVQQPPKAAIFCLTHVSAPIKSKNRWILDTPSADSFGTHRMSAEISLSYHPSVSTPLP